MNKYSNIDQTLSVLKDEALDMLDKGELVAWVGPVNGFKKVLYIFTAFKPVESRVIRVGPTDRMVKFSSGIYSSVWSFYYNQKTHDVEAAKGLLRNAVAIINPACLSKLATSQTFCRNR